MRQTAPTRKRNEEPSDYIVRVVKYLNRPKRRRLGVRASSEVLDAVAELKDRQAF